MKVQIHEVRDSTLIKFIEENTEYRDNGNHFQFGQLSNGAFVSSLLNFLDDNQNAVEAIVEFMEKNGHITEEEDEDLEEDE